MEDISYTDTEKLSSSLEGLAEIFEEVVEISRDDKSRTILAEDFTCKIAASRNFSTFLPCLFLYLHSLTQ